jgi:hypothetical protein
MLIGNASSLTSSNRPIALAPRFDHTHLDSSNSTLSLAAHSIVHWMSITPGLPSIGYHLLDKHRSLFACNLLILASSALEASVCRATLPDSLVVPTTLAAVVHCLNSPACTDPDTAAAFFHPDQPLHGADATCPHILPADQLSWLRALLDSINRFPDKFGLFCLVITIPLTEPSAACSTFASILSTALSSWLITSRVLNSATFGDGVSAL